MAAGLALWACGPNEGLPPDREGLMGGIPASARGPFDVRAAVAEATRACIRSELDGPATLRSLEQSGWTPFRDMDLGGYAKFYGGNKTGPFAPADYVRVGDRTARTDCEIQVPRARGREFYPVVLAEFERLGYGRFDYRDAPRFFRDGERFIVTGRYNVTTSAWAHFDIGRVDGASDRTCRDPNVPDTAKRGC
ncbi:hypothetical protein [Roseivivax jejudonensis]|nr:hypothetical protein [Roseivivax jejudonensis]